MTSKDTTLQSSMEELAEWEETREDSTGEVSSSQQVEYNGVERLSGVTEVSISEAPTWIIGEMLREAFSDQNDFPISEANRKSIFEELDYTVYKVNTHYNNCETYLVPELYGGLMENWNFKSAAHVIDEEMPVINFNESNLVYTGNISGADGETNWVFNTLVDSAAKSAFEFDNERRLLESKPELETVRFRLYFGLAFGGLVLTALIAPLAMMLWGLIYFPIYFILIEKYNFDKKEFKRLANLPDK